MSTDVLVAYLLIVIPALILIGVTSAGTYVVVKTLRDWAADPKQKTVPGGMWQACLFIVVLDVILLAGMDVGQFMVLWTESGEDLIMLVLAVFCPWLIYKAAKVKFTGASEDPPTGEPPEVEEEPSTAHPPPPAPPSRSTRGGKRAGRRKPSSAQA